MSLILKEILFLQRRKHGLLIVHPYPGAILEEESPLSSVVHDCDAVQVLHLRRMKTPLWLKRSR